jgi:hypothetical protein
MAGSACVTEAVATDGAAYSDMSLAAYSDMSPAADSPDMALAATCVYPRPAPTDCGPFAAACAGAVPLASGGTDVAGAFAIDEQFLYWAIDRESHSDGCDPAILRTDKRGGPATPLVANARAFALAVDAERLYWIGDSGIESAPKTGGAATTLVPHPDWPIVQYAGIAASGGFVYWAVWSENLGRTIWRVPTGGAAAATSLFTDPPGAPMTRFAIDGDYLYWAGEDAGWQGTLHRVALAGGAPESVVPGVALGEGAVAAGGGRVYFVDGTPSTVGGARPEMSIASAPVAGGAASTLVPASGSYLSEVALAGASLYWDESNGNPTAPRAAIHAAPVAGGAASTVWSGASPPPSGLLVDDTSVWFYLPVGPPENEIVGFRGGIIARAPR